MVIDGVFVLRVHKNAGFYGNCLKVREIKMR